MNTGTCLAALLNTGTCLYPLLPRPCGCAVPAPCGRTPPRCSLPPQTRSFRSQPYHTLQQYCTCSSMGLPHPMQGLFPPTGHPPARIVAPYLCTTPALPLLCTCNASSHWRAPAPPHPSQQRCHNPLAWPPPPHRAAPVTAAPPCRYSVPASTCNIPSSCSCPLLQRLPPTGCAKCIVTRYLCTTAAFFATALYLQHSCCLAPGPPQGFPPPSGPSPPNTYPACFCTKNMLEQNTPCMCGCNKM